MVCAPAGMWMMRWRRAVMMKRLMLQPVVCSIQRDTARAQAMLAEAQRLIGCVGPQPVSG